MNNNYQRFHWLRGKLLKEINDLILIFILSAFVVCSSYIVLQVIPHYSSVSWLVILAVILALTAIVFAIATFAIQKRQDSFLVKATKDRIIRNEGIYSFEETDLSPLTIYLRNSSSLQDKLIDREIKSITKEKNDNIPSIKLFGSKDSIDSHGEIEASDIFMLILDRDLMLDDKEIYQYAAKQNKTTFVFIKKSNNDKLDAENLAKNLLDSFVNPTKLAFFSSTDDLSQEIKILLCDTLISGYRKSRKITSDTPKVINRIADNIIHNPVAIGAKASQSDC
jgi:hypothetical protein